MGQADERSQQIAKVKTHCEEIVTSFRKNLVDATDRQGKFICSTDGTVLKMISVDEINTLLNAIRPCLQYQISPNQVELVSNDAFSIDLSYLYITGDSSPEKIRSIMAYSYKGSQFVKKAFFDNQVAGGLCFDHAKFMKGASFLCTFTGNVSFCNAVFEGSADFNRSRFHGKADYHVTSFYNSAMFQNVEFNNDCDFTNSIFGNKASFKSTKFSGHVDFTSAQFDDDADFSSAKFEAKTSFSNAQFKKPLWLHGSTLHQDTSFYNSKFSSFRTEEDLRAYRTLKQKMGDFRATEEEGKFFAYEQRTRCNLQLQKNYFSITGVLSKLYDLMSEYGENIARPIGWLVGITILFTILYSITGGICSGTAGVWITQLPPSLGLSLQNIFNPLGLFNTKAPLIVKSSLVAILSIFQSTLTLSTLALFLLAIRRRFHKGNGQ